jgi:adenosine deaminase
MGLRTVAHAGEEGPPEYVWQALDLLGAERIDHGVRSLEDPDLVKRLGDEQIPLTVCPLSNERLQVVPSLDRHPLARMLELGLNVSINSDDPAYFGGYIGDNYVRVAEALELSRDELETIARNSLASALSR